MILYFSLIQQISIFLVSCVVPKLQNQRDEFLLRQLVQSGSNHKIMNKWYRLFFGYLDRYYVKYHALPSLEDAGLTHFKTIVYEQVKKDACTAVLNMIDKEREGNTVDRGLIKSCIKIFEDMGMGSLSAYSADFEVYLLESTRTYYAMKSSIWIHEDSTPDYLIKAEKVIESEQQRVAACLNSDSEVGLLKVVEEEILEKRLSELLEKDGSGCRVLLANDKLEDLNRLYKLFSRVPNCLSPIADMLRVHILELGDQLISQKQARVDSKDDKDFNDDPQFVKDLLHLHDKFIELVTAQFAGNSLFQKALKDAFVEIVNRDMGKSRIADILSTFCDRILKTGSVEKFSDEEIEMYLEKTVQIFSYITEKDMFSDIYRNQLAKRLLNQRSASEDMEKLMIGKLKLRCGAQFTGKMEGMLNDLIIGTDHTKQFEDHCKENSIAKEQVGRTEFSVQVLTTGYWPSYRTQDVNLPPSMTKCAQVFKNYYETTTTHRRLQWIHVLGNATIKATFGKKTYDLQVVTLQAAVLLSFVDSNPRPFAQLLEELNVGEDVLKRTLHSLCCGKFKVLRRLEEVAENKNIIKNSDSFLINDGFT